MADTLPWCASFVERRVKCAIENQTMPLVVIGTPVILPDIEIVDRGTKEELADVVERLRPGV